MLLDGYWKRDLIRIKRQLKFWSRRSGYILHEYIEHRINRCLLFSTAIIRKIIEDEKDGENLYKEWLDSLKEEGVDTKPEKPEFLSLQYSVSITKYQHVDEEKIFINSKLILSDYDTEHGEQIELPLSQVCNQLIHSYVWGIVHSGKRIYGVMTASDKFKEKEVYLLKIEDWITALDFVIENCNIQSKESLI